MPARRPEEICSLFKQYMAEGDVELLLSLYDRDVVFLNSSGAARKGREELRQELAPLAAAKAVFDFNVQRLNKCPCMRLR